MARKQNGENDGKFHSSSNHGDVIRSRILKSARLLLAREGYSRTTIRKIVEHSGVLTGSIYYFFRNKEDIFREILLDIVHECITKIDARCRDESPLFRYAAVCQVELRVLNEYKIVRETYRSGYASATIFEGMIVQFQEMARYLFQGTAYERSDEEYYLNTLMIKGAMHACLSEMFFRRPIDTAASRERLLRLSLMLWGADKQECDAVLERIKINHAVWDEIGREMVEKP